MTLTKHRKVFIGRGGINIRSLRQVHGNWISPFLIISFNQLTMESLPYLLRFPLDSIIKAHLTKVIKMSLERPCTHLAQTQSAGVSQKTTKQSFLVSEQLHRQ